MISCEGLHKSYGQLKLLENVTFRINEGEKVSLVGPGGCGKTTLLKLILGLEAYDGGKATILGIEMQASDQKTKNEAFKKIGMAFQQGGLFDFMTVEENLSFAMAQMTQKTEEERNKTIQDLLNAVKLPGVEKQFPHELSGGMRRRVGIARALCSNPTVALFDEPTSGLDPVTSTIILEMISNLSLESKRTLLVSTSNVEIAIRFADRILILNEGRIIADGPWRELLLSGSEWVKHFLSVRLIGLDLSYARTLDLPEPFLEKYWKDWKPETLSEQAL